MSLELGGQRGEPACVFELAKEQVGVPACWQSFSSSFSARSLAAPTPIRSKIGSFAVAAVPTYVTGLTMPSRATARTRCGNMLT